MMKRKLIAALFLLTMASVCKSYGQDRSYTITTIINGIPDGTFIYLIRTNDFGKADTLHRIAARSGRAVFKGTNSLISEPHFVKIDTAIVKLQKIDGKKRQSWVRVMLDNADIKVNGDLTTWPDAKIVNSPATLQYERTSAIFKKIIDEGNIKIKALGNDARRIAIAKREMAIGLIKAMHSHKDDVTTPSYAVNINLLTTSEKSLIYNALTEKIKNSYYGLKLKKDVADSKIRETIAEGKIVPNFEFETSEGKTLSILELASKSKLTLVDFWASWCSPCRSEIPNLKKVYADFKSQGFNIVGLSGDEKEVAWRKALLEENMPWFQAIAKNVRVSKDIFGLSSIPAYLLIDQKGRMIAFERGVGTVPAFGPDIRGEELKDTLAKLLKSM